ncbi:MAG: right-handed parallel beta-helix repeat-containing protein, partial [Armatimonadota bacterium]
PNVDPEDPHFGTWAHILDVAGGNVRDRFTCTDDVVKDWTRVERARICIHPGYDWAWNIVPLQSADPETGEIVLGRETSYDLRVGDRFYVENLLEELDAPGEWYLDVEGEALYFWPPADLAEGDVLAAVTDTVLRMEGAEHVLVRGLQIEACNGNAVEIRDCEECVIAASVIRSCGGSGVVIDGGHGSGAFGNDISQTGRGGISLSGGDRETLERAGNFAENNYIHHVARIWRTYRTGVNCRGVGNRVSRNLIHDTYHAGMTLGGNENVVELNHVHHTNLGSADTGGIYFCSRDWTQRGNVIRHNIFHHVGGFGKASAWQPVHNGKVKFEYPHFTWGIYLDDPTSGTTVYGNILYSVPVCGLHNHGGRDNTFANNVVVDCPGFRAGHLSPGWSEWDRIRERLHQYVYEGSPYLQLYPELADYGDENPEEMSGLRIERNIFFYSADIPQWLREGSGWEDGMPTVVSIRCREEDWPEISFDRNLIYTPEGMEPRFRYQDSGAASRLLTWDQWRELGADEHSRLADPLFVDPASDDYRLREDSPAFELGFEPIPVDQIGPYDHELRATWPIEEAPGASRLGDFHTERYFELPGYEPVPARPVAVRDGTPNALAKLRAGEPVRVAYFGGGIHPADGWRAQVLGALRERFPAAQITEIDASICDCVRGIGFSVYRFRHDVLGKQPDAVLVDFTSGDHGRDMIELMRAAEGLVRQAWAADPEIDLLFLYAYHPGQQESYEEGLFPAEVSAYEKVAEHYGIPSISMGYRIAELVQAGRMRVQAEPDEEGDLPRFTTEGRRPTDAAKAVYARSIIEALESIAAAGGATHRLPEPLRADNLERARLVPITAEMLEGDWERRDPRIGERDFSRHFDDLWVTESPGARLSFRFRGTEASLFNLIGPDHGSMRVTVDGEEAGVRTHVDRWCYYHRLSATALASDLEDTEHTVTVELLPDSPNRAVAIDEAKRLDRYDAEAFEGVALYLGWLRVIGEPAD